jgi:hypothetical protein
MHRRNILLVALTLLLTGIAACKYHPTVDPDNLLCEDDNGCPLGYSCVVDAGSGPGYCSAPDAASGSTSTD